MDIEVVIEIVIVIDVEIEIVIEIGSGIRNQGLEIKDGNEGIGNRQ